MLNEFRVDVKLERFAYVTGRSDTRWKRDCKEVLGTTPRNWLKNKRRDVAFVQISKKHQRESHVYIDVGFENLSHFSLVFKEKFGKTPKEVFQEK